MSLLESGTFPYIAFIVSASVEQYFFMMQRSAQAISREVGIGVKEGRPMLPFWYLLVWPAKVVKWAAAIYIGMEFSWILAAVLLIVTFAFQLFVPIPHRAFIPIFRRKIAKEIGESMGAGIGPEAETYARLYSKLFDANQDPRFD